MDWWDDAVCWLNANEGAVTALATIGAGIFTALAATAAWITLRASKRRERCNIFFAFRRNWVPAGANHEHALVIEPRIMNHGPARPLWVRMRIHTRDGVYQTYLGKLPPGKIERAHQLFEPLSRQKFVLEWMEPDGRMRRIRCFYQATLPLEAAGNDSGLLEGVGKWQSREDRPRPLRRMRYFLPLRGLRGILTRKARHSTPPVARE
ncbi:hypothetical protein ACXR2T_10810 [Leucobacter sp. HY1910]